MFASKGKKNRMRRQLPVRKEIAAERGREARQEADWPFPHSQGNGGMRAKKKEAWAGSFPMCQEKSLRAWLAAYARQRMAENCGAAQLAPRE